MVTYREVHEIDLAAGETKDVTALVGEAVARSGLREGLACAFLPHSTAALVLVEYEPGLESDLHDALERLSPRDIEYAHQLAWNDDNGHSHVRATFLGATQTVPFTDRKPEFGTWQQLVMLELDQGRRRRLIIQLVGE